MIIVSTVLIGKLVTPINGISAFTKLFYARKTQKTISKLLKSQIPGWLSKKLHIQGVR
jgi:hypothetical protein